MIVEALEKYPDETREVLRTREVPRKVKGNTVLINKTSKSKSKTKGRFRECWAALVIKQKWTALDSTKGRHEVIKFNFRLTYKPFEVSEEWIKMLRRYFYFNDIIVFFNYPLCLQQRYIQWDSENSFVNIKCTHPTPLSAAVKLMLPKS